MTIQLTEQQGALVMEGIWSTEAALKLLRHQLMLAFGDAATIPEAVRTFTTALHEMAKALDDAKTKALEEAKPLFPVELSLDHGPMLRTVVQSSRREKAQQIEGFRANASDAAVVASLDAQLAPFRELMLQEWFMKVAPYHVPKLADYVTLQRLVSTAPPVSVPAPTFEDKFRILYAPSTLPAQLAQLRDECASRDLPVSVVFLDLDNFKAMNTKYGETRVDADLLPVFMRVVERTVFGHGYAYRHGGDEIVLLLPNSTSQLAQALLEQLRQSLTCAPYAGIPERPTVSCGLCVVHPSSWLTDQEALERAARAKKFAKEQGRNAVASYSTLLYRDNDLFLLTASAARAGRTPKRS